MKKRQDMCYEILMEDLLTQKVPEVQVAFSVVDRVVS